MASIFTKIINGEIPCHKIAENENFFAFLDIQPLAKGHTLIIPKQEIDYLFDITPTDLGNMMQFVQTVAKAIQQATPCRKVGVAVIGLEVPHAHIHLIPMNQVSDMNFANPKLQLDTIELADIAKKIRSFLAN